jgi:hypothetical protein
LNIDEARWQHKIAIILSYGGPVVIYIGYTTYFLLQAPHVIPWLRAMVGIGYVLVIGVVALSWLAGFGSYRTSAEQLEFT